MAPGTHTRRCEIPIRSRLGPMASNQFVGDVFTLAGKNIIKMTTTVGEFLGGDIQCVQHADEKI